MALPWEMDWGEGGQSGVRIMNYGRNVGEFNHAADFGPSGNELGDDEAAISPGLAARMGIPNKDIESGKGYWIHPPAGPRRANDWSYTHPGEPSDVRFPQGAIEMRNTPDLGRGTVRAAKPWEIPWKGTEQAPTGEGPNATPPSDVPPGMGDEPPVLPPDAGTAPDESLSG